MRVDEDPRLRHANDVLPALELGRQPGRDVVEHEPAHADREKQGDADDDAPPPQFVEDAGFQGEACPTWGSEEATDARSDIFCGSPAPTSRGRPRCPGYDVRDTARGGRRR